MTDKKIITHAEVFHAAEKLSAFLPVMERPLLVYPISRGGIPAAYALMTIRNDIKPCHYPDLADFILDDLVDSGATRDRYVREHPNKPFYSLFTKCDSAWWVFPWEIHDEEHMQDNDIGVRLLQFIGEDPLRGGLVETPSRFLQSWVEKTCGYNQTPGEVLKVFEDGAADVDEMILVRDIDFESVCEHHMERIWGVVHIGYIPNGKIVGLSKLWRLTDIFARRLQVQERLTGQIADVLVEYLSPIGVGVVVEARHSCMESRGINKRGQLTITSALRGVIKEKPEARSEFLSLARGGKLL